MYGDPDIGKVNSVRGKVRGCLSMTLDDTKRGDVNIDMINYLKHD